MKGRLQNKRMNARGILLNVCVLLISCAVLFPLFWIVVTACKGQAEIIKNPLGLIPARMMFWENFKEVMSRAPWGRYYQNTVLLALGILAVQLLISIPAAYAFGVMKFKGRNILFLLVLTRLMVSPESTMLANYLTIINLGLYDTLAGIAMPYVVSAIAISMFRQAFRQIPPALQESAGMDGCSTLRYLISIAVPLSTPYIISFSIISVVFQWNAFFWPILITDNMDNRVLAIALAYFGLQAESGSEWGLTMVAALIVILPLLLAFAFFQEKFIDSFINSGIK